MRVDDEMLGRSRRPILLVERIVLEREKDVGLYAFERQHNFCDIFRLQ